MAIKHKFASGKAAAADPTLVDGPNWDDEHILDGGLVDQVVTRDPAFDPPNGPGFKLAYPRLRETGDPATLTPGAIPDGTYLRREGALLVGASDVVRVLDRQVTMVDVVNTAVETDLYRVTVPGGTLGTSRVLRLSLVLDHRNENAGGLAEQSTVRVRYGPNVIGGFPMEFGLTPGVRQAIAVTLLLWAQGSANAQAVAGVMLVGEPLSPNSSRGAFNDVGFGTTDSTVDQDLAVTIEHDFADPNVSTRRHLALLELLP